MADGFLDTVVLVDILRQFEPAQKWAESNLTGRLAITPLVWMELVYGTRDRRHQHRATGLLSLFEMVQLTEADVTWAMDQLARFHLSHNVGVLDCLIAAPAFRLQLPLYTHNLKHFAPLLGDLARKPY